MRVSALVLMLSVVASSQARAEDGRYHLCTPSDPCGPGTTSGPDTSLSTGLGSSSGSSMPPGESGFPAAPSPSVPAPANAVAEDFAGTWEVHVSDGSVFPMSLYPSGKRVGGTYDPAGRSGSLIDGRIKHNTLKFKWLQTGTIKGFGEGKFHMNDANSLSGSWTMGVFSGLWVAYRR